MHVVVGTPHERIAKAMGIGLSTLQKHYREELDTAADKANKAVAGTLFHKATVEKDTTAIGRDMASEPIKYTMGNYRALSMKAVKSIPGAQLVLFPDLGHAPQVQNPDRFHTALVNQLVALQGN
jgi:hypothetical protein